jgi:hypothetical protein
MSFLLSRNGDNVAAEVERWQYFLIKQGIPVVGGIDGSFGLLTEQATTAFQTQMNVPRSGALDAATLSAAKSLGYFVVPDDHYDRIDKPNFPPRPRNLRSPSNDDRNDVFKCFTFSQRPRAERPRDNVEEIIVHKSCDGTLPKWEDAQIVRVQVPQLVHVRGELTDGFIRIHRLLKDKLLQLFAAWDEANVAHLVIHFSGSFVPRYKRNRAPRGNGPQPERSSRDVEQLSNHSFGSAFDLNDKQNAQNLEHPVPPAPVRAKGTLRELVPIANSRGWFWGGHFGAGSVDGMHFEFADFDSL